MDWLTVVKIIGMILTVLWDYWSKSSSRPPKRAMTARSVTDANWTKSF